MPKQFPEWTFLYGWFDDDMPPENVGILMTDGNWVDAGIFENGVFYPSSEPESWCKDSAVIAWMPLPAAPVHPSVGTAGAKLEKDHDKK